MIHSNEPKITEGSEIKTHKPKKSILKNNNNKIDVINEDMEYSSLLCFPKKIRHSQTRLCLKFEEDINISRFHYPFDDSSRFCCSDSKRKESEEMKLDSHIFCKYNKSGTLPIKKIPDLFSPNPLNSHPNKLNFNNNNNIIEEEDDDDCMLDCIQKINSCIFVGGKQTFNGDIRKSSSIMDKLELGIKRKSTTGLRKPNQLF